MSEQAAEANKAARLAESKAAATRRARELEKAAALIGEERDTLVEQLEALRAREVEITNEATGLPELRRQIQALAYKLNRPPFNLDTPTLGRLTGRTKQRVSRWIEDKPWLRTGGK